MIRFPWSWPELSVFQVLHTNSGYLKCCPGSCAVVILERETRSDAVITIEVTWRSVKALL